MNHRKIIHLDLDAFYCAVEEQYDPSLRGLAFAVGGRPETRGVVASCSYAARKFGVRSAMPMARAVKLCPQLKIVAGNHKRYAQASRQVMDELHKVTELVEQVSIDEAFLDVTQDSKSVDQIARELQSAIRKRLGLPCSLGVATNKLVAKIATDVGKASIRSDGPPNAIQIVAPGQEAGFLDPLPTEALWGIGPKTAARLAELGIHTIGEIAKQSEKDLARWFGKHGRDIYLRSMGVDRREVEPVREAKSVSKETTFPRDISDGSKLRNALFTLSEGVVQRLRRENRAGSTVKIKLRWSDFTTLTRQITLDQPTADLEVIYEAAIQLFHDLWTTGRPVRLLGVGISSLGPPNRQLTLWNNQTGDQNTAKERRLESAIAQLQEKFGDQVIHWGNDRTEDS